ncbi:hypothetical protein F4820DRAFT_433673 [Hypoxylon rubiginosum]|uniref:Uncharacterized protein n=1 Tax=Hypoxylon rubiginosum TaxID=110542 RepID=A0ACB9YQ09_9PEZI|nr:hypothetical protein F4820DRAFT_433673 [Hypoxylon rubiginosum]
MQPSYAQASGWKAETLPSSSNPHGSLDRTIDGWPRFFNPGHSFQGLPSLRLGRILRDASATYLPTTLVRHGLPTGRWELHQSLSTGYRLNIGRYQHPATPISSSISGRGRWRKRVMPLVRISRMCMYVCMYVCCVCVDACLTYVNVYVHLSRSHLQVY